jgi:hypothetical protein
MIMIRQLVRTEFESNLVNIGQTTLIILLMSLLLSTLMLDSDGDDKEMFIVMALILSSVMGARIYLRYSRQKHTRIYAQLPVTSREVCIATWCFTFACLLLPTSFWLLFLALHVDYDDSQLLPAVTSFYLALTALIAVISIATKIANLSSPQAGYWKWVYATGFLIFSLILTGTELGTLIVFLEEETADWAVVVPVMLLTSVGLVAADFWLHKRVDNYLG